MTSIRVIKIVYIISFTLLCWGVATSIKKIIENFKPREEKSLLFIPAKTG